jgi:hypothetical protein
VRIIHLTSVIHSNNKDSVIVRPSWSPGHNFGTPVRRLCWLTKAVPPPARKGHYDNIRSFEGKNSRGLRKLGIETDRGANIPISDLY